MSSFAPFNLSPLSEIRLLETLCVTGQRLRGRLIVTFDGQSIALTADQFDTLVVLAHQRVVSTTGLATLRDFAIDDAQHLRTRIWRLRTALNAALGDGIGNSLVQTGLKNEYVLNVPPQAIRFDSSCRDLPRGVTSLSPDALLAVITQ